ncbi:alkyl hydroperoxide reductase [Geomonas silvestris]|uniref:thioredoxin-dependent peroxiredoxin n=1 Tax=Geomonas silvestris TaxID=2740184 RepID=A0A6V8MMD7_9BACT|nr:peroxiredoxin-like family protein [Geomonas silvestris]GFO61215.1 alkyl hydroperoxide reductase [Geomonas silvestris]
MEPELRTQIEELERSLPPLPPEQSQQLEEAARQLALSGIAERVLKAGGQAPDFTLPNAVGRPTNLEHALARGPVLVTFYRGIWCPYCSLQLRAYQKILPEIMRLGGSLIAISPQSPDKSQATLLKNFLMYEVLSDQGNQVARQFGLVYQVPEALRPIYTSLGTDLPAYNGDDSWELPIPGTFLIGRDRRILLSYADSDPRNRLEPSAIVEALEVVAEHGGKS